MYYFFLYDNFPIFNNLLVWRWGLAHDANAVRNNHTTLHGHSVESHNANWWKSSFYLLWARRKSRTTDHHHNKTQ